VDAPGGKLDFHFAQGLPLGEDVLIDALNQRAVEIGEKAGLAAVGVGDIRSSDVLARTNGYRDGSGTKGASE